LSRQSGRYAVTDIHTKYDYSDLEQANKGDKELMRLLLIAHYKAIGKPLSYDIVVR
jgi:hypothetical protein